MLQQLKFHVSTDLNSFGQIIIKYSEILRNQPNVSDVLPNIDICIFSGAVANLIFEDGKK